MQQLIGVAVSFLGEQWHTDFRHSPGPAQTPSLWVTHPHVEKLEHMSPKGRRRVALWRRTEPSLEFEHGRI